MAPSGGFFASVPLVIWAAGGAVALLATVAFLWFTARSSGSDT
ncbi:MAG: hypothetical protein NTW19_21530 [Planctomycetota bacterium]|nr:hypothetical protein [Planctomycetota bacterium]